MTHKMHGCTSLLHTWAATVGVIFGIVTVIWTTALANRELVVTSDYRVEDGKLEGFKPIFKHLIFTFRISNKGNGDIVIKNLLLGRSEFEVPDKTKQLSVEEQYEYIKKYWRCEKWTARGNRDVGKDFAFISAGETRTVEVTYDALETAGATVADSPGKPICLAATIMDQFGMTHRIVEPIGSIKTGAGRRHPQTGAEMMNFELTHRKYFHLLEKEKCIKISSKLSCL